MLYSATAVELLRKQTFEFEYLMPKADLLVSDEYIFL